jgi:hypothetical protein
MWGFGTFWVATAATGSLYHTRKLKLFKDKVLHMDNVADRCVRPPSLYDCNIISPAT